MELTKEIAEAYLKGFDAGRILGRSDQIFNQMKVSKEGQEYAIELPVQKKRGRPNGSRNQKYITDYIPKKKAGNK